MQKRLTQVANRLFLLDTQFGIAERVAAYLINEPGAGAALVDCGGTKSVPHILAALQQHGVATYEVQYILATHVHIDHAGGVGELLKFLPNARVLAHPSAIKHLVNPAKLMQSTVMVYGQEAVDNHIGAMVPVPPERIEAVSDYQTIYLGTRALQFIDTPGHAYHHYVVWDATTSTVIAGDTYGNSYANCACPQGYVFTTPAVPTQFDPPAWRASLVKLAALSAENAAVAHFGIYSDTARITAQLTEQLHFIESFATELDPKATDLSEQIEQSLYAHYHQLWQQHGCYEDVRSVLSASRDLRMVISGIAYWLQKARAQ